MRLTTLRLLPLFVAAACGGRSALDDAGFLVDDDDAVSASGGRNSGGAPPHLGSGGGRAFGSGGRPAFDSGGRAGSGGAGMSPGGVSSTGGISSAGGAFPAGGSPGCPSGSWGDRDSCQDWTACEPGEYIHERGSTVTDTTCVPCPPDSYSSEPNQAGCLYSGCAFSELVVTPATPTSPAGCLNDADYSDLGTNGSIIGLSHLGTKAYLALNEYGQDEMRQYEFGAPMSVQTFPPAGYGGASAFALATDGTIYLQGTKYGDVPLPWLQAYSTDLSLFWSATVGAYESGGYGVGLVTTDSHWISWQLGPDAGSTELTLLSSPHPNYARSSGVVSLGGGLLISSLVADDQETIWLTGFRGGTQQLGRIVGLADPLELYILPGSIEANLVTVAPSGTAYVVGTGRIDGLRFSFFEFDSNGVEQRSWSYSADEGTFLMPTALAVDPGNALYAAFASWHENSSGFFTSFADIFMLKLDLTTGAITTNSFAGPVDDRVHFMTVTTDGTLYLAGKSGASSFIRKIY